MKKTAVFALVLASSLLLLELGLRHVSAIPRGPTTATPTFENNGDTKASVNVTCSSTAWTSLLSARPKRRMASVINLTTNNTVCLSTSTSGGTCLPATTDPSHGVIEPGGSFTEHSESVVYCKAKAAAASAQVYGTDEYDSGD